MSKERTKRPLIICCIEIAEDPPYLMVRAIFSNTSPIRTGKIAVELFKFYFFWKVAFNNCRFKMAADFFDREMFNNVHF